jgi:hypothetical protein
MVFGLNVLSNRTSPDANGHTSWQPDNALRLIQCVALISAQSDSVRGINLSAVFIPHQALPD